MEGVPKMESKEAAPRIKREQVVEGLKQNPLDHDLFIRYRDQETEGHRTSADTLAFNLEEARIYRDAGLLEMAQSAYEAALEMALNKAYADGLKNASQEENDKLIAEIEKEIEGLDARGE